MTTAAKLKQVHKTMQRKFKDKKLVFGKGLQSAKVVVVSDIIGANEHKERRPLAQKPTKYLTKLLKSVGIDSKNVYLTSVVKYYPNSIIPLTPKELKSHGTLLREELKAIEPELVITLGSTALNGVGLRQPVENVHGRTFHLGTHKLFPTFHPSLALKNSSVQSQLEADFTRLKEHLANQAIQSSESEQA